MIFTRSQPQLDECSRVGHGLVLPSVIGLIPPHGFLARLIPFPGRLALQVMLADERFLDCLCAFRINLLLSPHP